MAWNAEEAFASFECCSFGDTQKHLIMSQLGGFCSISGTRMLWYDMKRGGDATAMDTWALHLELFLAQKRYHATHEANQEAASIEHTHLLCSAFGGDFENSSDTFFRH